MYVYQCTLNNYTYIASYSVIAIINFFINIALCCNVCSLISYWINSAGIRCLWAISACMQPFSTVYNNIGSGYRTGTGSLSLPLKSR